MMTAQRFWSVAELAALLGVNVAKVAGWIRSGELPAVNVALRRGIGCRPRWRIPQASLDTFLRQRESTPTPKIRRQRRDREEPIFFSGGRPVASQG